MIWIILIINWWRRIGPSPRSACADSAPPSTPRAPAPAPPSFAVLCSNNTNTTDLYCSLCFILSVLCQLLPGCGPGVRLSVLVMSSESILCYSVWWYNMLNYITYTYIYIYIYITHILYTERYYKRLRVRAGFGGLQSVWFVFTRLHPSGHS